MHAGLPPLPNAVFLIVTEQMSNVFMSPRHSERGLSFFWIHFTQCSCLSFHVHAGLPQISHTPPHRLPHFASIFQCAFVTCPFGDCDNATGPSQDALLKDFDLCGDVAVVRISRVLKPHTISTDVPHHLPRHRLGTITVLHVFRHVLE